METGREIEEIEIEEECGGCGFDGLGVAWMHEDAWRDDTSWVLLNQVVAAWRMGLVCKMREGGKTVQNIEDFSVWLGPCTWVSVSKESRMETEVNYSVLFFFYGDM